MTVGTKLRIRNLSKEMMGYVIHYEEYQRVIRVNVAIKRSIDLPIPRTIPPLEERETIINDFDTDIDVYLKTEQRKIEREGEEDEDCYQISDYFDDLKIHNQEECFEDEPDSNFAAAFQEEYDFSEAGYENEERKSNFYPIDEENDEEYWVGIIFHEAPYEHMREAVSKVPRLDSKISSTIMGWESQRTLLPLPMRINRSDARSLTALSREQQEIIFGVLSHHFSLIQVANTSIKHYRGLQALEKLILLQLLLRYIAASSQIRRY